MHKTPRYALLLDTDCENANCEPPCDPASGGLTKIACADTVIAQGVGGDSALDNLIRESLQYERGSTLCLGVSYSQIRAAVVQSKITKMVRIFLPEQVVVYVQPIKQSVANAESMGATGEEQQHLDGPGVCTYIRVRVFRFLTLPQDRGSDEGCKRKATHTRVEYASDESDTDMGTKRAGVYRDSNSSHAKPSKTHHSNTLRHRSR